MRLRRTIAELGFLNSLLYAFAKGLSCLTRRAYVHRYYFVAQPIASTARLGPRRGQALQVRRLPPDDPSVYSIGRPADVIRQRFAQGALCFGVFSDTRLIGCLWLIVGPYIEDEVRCRFVPAPAGQVAWDFDVYIDPAHRLGFAFARLWDTANVFLTEQGVRWTVSRISAFNPGSLAAHRRLGARRIGSALYLGLGSWQLMVADVRPYVHLGVKPGHVPELTLVPPG